MTRLIAGIAIGSLAVLSFSATAVGREVFVSTRLSAVAGYDDNRLEEFESGEGSPFWQICPGIDVTAFGERTETSLFVDYRRTQYTESDFESKDEASASARWRCFGGQNEAGASAGGGLYRDKALPENDCTYWQVKPYMLRTLEILPAEISLKGSYRQTRYEESIYSSTTDRTDGRLEVRPGLRWHLSHHLTVWGELYAEYNVSDAAEAEYSGFGGALGCEFRPTPRLELGSWAETGTRPYSEEVEGESRRDTPWLAGGWVTYRIRPWLEWFASVDWGSHASTTYDDDYNGWSAGSGVRIVFEHEVAGR
jgi:hypothetical protein